MVRIRIPHPQVFVHVCVAMDRGTAVFDPGLGSTELSRRRRTVHVILLFLKTLDEADPAIHLEAEPRAEKHPLALFTITGRRRGPIFQVPPIAHTWRRR